MHSFISLFTNIKKNNFENFYQKYLGKKYAAGEQKISSEEIKKLFTTALREYFYSSISRMELKWIASDLMMHLVKNHWNPPKNRKLFDLKFGKDEELYHDIYWVAESSDYFLSTSNWEMNPAIKTLISELKEKSRKYSNEMDLKLEAKFKITGEIEEMIITLSEIELKELFVELCKQHDAQKVSIDTISAFAEVIHKSNKNFGGEFSEILESVSELAALERKCDDESLFADFSSKIRVINNYLLKF